MYKKFNLKVAHTPRNTICNHVLPKRRNTGAFDKTAFYQLKFQDCQLKYMGRLTTFETRHNEHVKGMKTKSNSSICSQYILDMEHAYGNIHTLEIQQKTKNDPLRNGTENYCS
jgi:hypothetical protein